MFMLHDTCKQSQRWPLLLSIEPLTRSFMREIFIGQLEPHDISTAISIDLARVTFCRSIFPRAGNLPPARCTRPQTNFNPQLPFATQNLRCSPDDSPGPRCRSGYMTCRPLLLVCVRDDYLRNLDRYALLAAPPAVYGTQSCVWRLSEVPSRDYQILRHASSGDISSLGETDRTLIGMTRENRQVYATKSCSRLALLPFSEPDSSPQVEGLIHCATAVHEK